MASEIVVCESKEDAVLIASAHRDFHNKTFPNDIWEIDIQDWCHEARLVDAKYKDPVGEIYQW